MNVLSKGFLTAYISALVFATQTGASEASLSEKAFAILEETCFQCHGPERVRGGLRLDSRADALLGGDSGLPSFSAGNSEESELFRRLLSADEDERMPQNDPPLDATEIEVIRQWIDAGAEWIDLEATPRESSHWAFRKPVAPESPPPNAWDRNPIDAFLRSRMSEVNLQPSPEADRATLIRRLSLDLTGLPPTVETLEDFLEDRSGAAYEKLVERLLASPHYGEHQARYWLDAARYADTNGYEKDRARSIWPYRDWVIDAFNAGKPFDEFVVEQLAGDLLPTPTVDQLIATGFHRNAMLNEEGGIDAEEDRFKRVVDRVNTTGTVFLGLTVGCAQCHSHKYDPISQREYYELFAFFNTTIDAEMTLPSPTVEAERAEINDRIQRVEELSAWVAERTPDARTEFETWRQEIEARCVPWQIVHAPRVASQKFATMRLLDDGSVLATGDIPNDDIYEISFDTGGQPVTALRLEVLPHESLPGGGPGRGVILAEGDFLLTGIDIEAGGRRVPVSAATESYAAEDYGAAQALDGRSDTGWSVKERIGQAHAAVFQFEYPVTEPTIRVRLHQDYIHQHTIGRFRLSLTSAAGEIQASGVPAEIETALLEGDTIAVRRYFAIHVAESLAEPRERLAEMRENMPTLATTLVTEERAEPRTAYIHHRGEFLEPRDAVDADVPDVLHAFPDEFRRDRLGFARWLVSEDNTLLARVTMNRLWQQLFGRGLVTTPEDFGTRGAAPSHPELLDWLAIEFMQRDWSLQEMTRLIVSSSAYRQSSNVTADHLKHDPANVWLARAPRFRVDAEVVRDIALAACGLLDSRIGGPSVYPPQPDGVTSLAYGQPEWPVSTGPDRYRRGFYTYWKRTAPYAMATTFDAPTADETCVMRRRSNTPLQALTLLNDDVFMETAQALARRVLNEAGGEFDARLELLYRLCLSRAPSPREAERVNAYLQTIKSQLLSKNETWADLAGLDAKNPFMPSPTDELAAWTLLSRAILNLDETITRE